MTSLNEIKLISLNELIKNANFKKIELDILKKVPEFTNRQYTDNYLKKRYALWDAYFLQSCISNNTTLANEILDKIIRKSLESTVEKKDENKNTAFIMACKNNMSSIVKRLLSDYYRIDFKSVNKEGFTGLMYICENNYYECLNLGFSIPNELININSIEQANKVADKFNLNAKNANNETALMISYNKGNIKCIPYLFNLFKFALNTDFFTTEIDLSKECVDKDAMMYTLKMHYDLMKLFSIYNGYGLSLENLKIELQKMKINNITNNQIKNKMIIMGISTNEIKYEHYKTKEAIKKVIKDKIINKIKEILNKIENVKKNTNEIKELIEYIKTIFKNLLYNTETNNQKNIQNKINQLYDKYRYTPLTLLYRSFLSFLQQ